MSQPPARRLHAPRPKHRLRYLLCFRPSVVTPARYGVSTRFIFFSELRSVTSARVQPGRTLEEAVGQVRQVLL